jgi:signal transduction histidine kinase
VDADGVTRQMRAWPAGGVWLLVVVGLFSLVFGWLMWTGVLGEPSSTVVDDMTQLGVALVASAACVVAARRRGGRMRTGWALMAAAMAAWALGQVAWSYLELVLGRPVTGTTIADIGFLAAVAIEVAAVLAFPFVPVRPAALIRLFLDGLLIASSLFFVSYLFVLRAVVDTSSSPSLDLAVNLAYPVGDVATCAVVLLALSRASGHLRSSLFMLGAGLVSMAVSDSFFAYASAAGTYHTGSWLDAGWVLGFLLIAVAATLDREGVAQRPVDEAEGRLQAVLPHAVAAAAILAAAIYFATGGTSSAGIRLSALAVFGIATAGLIVHRLDLLHLLKRHQSAEAALLDNQAIINRLVETAPVALFSIGRDGRIRFARGRVLAELSENVTELEGRLAEDLLGRLPAAQELLAQALAGERSAGSIEGTANVFEMVCSPVRGPDGGIESVTGVVVDVTTEQRLRRATDENAAKSRLLASVSHELRTPLNVVLGFTDLLKLESQGALTAKQRRYLVNIESSGRHLLHLINVILDFSKLAAGAMFDVQLTRLDLGQALSGVVEKLEPLAGGRRLKIETGCRDLAVLADPMRVEQILLNLYSNAIKSTGEDGSVTASCGRDGLWVEITISDDGVGIPADALDRIFDEYTQVADHWQVAGGTGLGLPVSRRLAELMKGTLTVDSEVRRGSAFRLRLPAAS